MPRCQYTGRRGQCNHSSIDNSQYCSRHSNEEHRMRKYRIQNPDLQERLGHHDDEASLKTVEQEIVLLRSMIEDRLNLAENKAERLSAYSVVTPMIGQVNKLVENLGKLRTSSSTLLNKEALRKLGDQIVHILVEELRGVPESDTILERVAERVADAIAEAKNEDN